MTEKSIIIIGAGMAGLSTGIYGQMNGYRTRIFEHDKKPGGVCTAWKRKGYTFDGCIHWLVGTKPDAWFFQIYSEVGALEGDPLRLIKHYVRYIDEASGQILDVAADLDRLAADVRALSPDDGPIIDELVEGARNLKGVDMNFDISRESKGSGDMLDYFMRYNTPANEFAERFSNPFLRWCVTNIFIPTMPTAFLFMILGRLENGEMARVEGGSLDFSLRVAKRYRDLGGKVKYGATVEEILVEDDRAVGVRLADGSEHRADIVVSCADGYSTIFKMLGERYINQKIKDRYANWPMFPPILIISFGVANDFAGEAPSNTVRLQRPITLGGKEFEAFGFRIYNDDPTMAPPGKTVVQVTLRTDFDWWCDLQEKDRASYDAEKERVAKDVLAQLECYLPGITSQVEVTDVATPYTFWRYTRNYRGAFEGWLLAPETMGTSVEKTLPGLSNFYMAGQWVEPGGGIPSALFSGRNLMNKLCRKDGKEFSASMP